LGCINTKQKKKTDRKKKKTEKGVKWKKRQKKQAGVRSGTGREGVKRESKRIRSPGENICRMGGGPKGALGGKGVHHSGTELNAAGILNRNLREKNNKKKSG